jgi:nitroreductase
MNEVMEIIRRRRSVRAYKPDQIDEAVIKEILEAGVYAPTSCNEQPWHFTVVQNAQLLDEINVKSKTSMASSGVSWMENMASDPEFTVTYCPYCYCGFRQAGDNSMADGLRCGNPEYAAGCRKPGYRVRLAGAFEGCSRG